MITFGNLFQDKDVTHTYFIYLGDKPALYRSMLRNNIGRYAHVWRYTRVR